MASIVDVELMPVAIHGDSSGECDGTVDTLVVRLVDENGLAGIGECDAPPTVAKAFIEMPSAHIWSLNPIDILKGRDPLEVTAIWQDIYDGTLYPGRRGLGIHALSAIDIALHDLAARQIDQPVYKLMGGARRPYNTPYATVFPGMPQGRSMDALMQIIGSRFARAVELGFRAVKLELMFDDLVDDDRLIDTIREARKMLGDDIRLLLDFAYRWRDWQDARRVLNRVASCDIFLAEATLQHDDLHGHARLSDHTDVRIGGGEFAATRWELREWIETAKVSVLQPDINRCGGLTEIRRIADMAELYGVQVVPHGWKTGITSACGQHFQASTLNAPHVEYISPHLFDSPLRRDLAPFDLQIEDGRVRLPEGPGLGAVLNDECVERYMVKNMVKIA
ncbi:MAG: mandelate racemase [Phycisphaeraceae bacterium]|nr:mandelate racemase [Phycisphaeraceae bacterium]